MTGGTTSPGRKRRGRQFPERLLDRPVPLVRRTAVTATSPPTSRRWTCRRSTQRHHHPRPAAFHDIVDANRAPEDADLADVLDASGNPSAITLDTLVQNARYTQSPSTTG